jgi:hypothetical protein
MPKFTKNVTIEGVDRIFRPGIGYVYKGRMSIGDVAEALKRGDIKYAPKYQRGQKKAEDVDFDATTLLEITDPKLDIQVRRAQAMAAKYVMGMFDKPDREFYNPDIIWNARKDENAGEVEYAQNKRILTVHSTITIPDSAHRHYCYYLLYQWQHQPESIPVEVVVADDGTTVDGDEIREQLENFDPFDEEKASTFVEIFNVPADHEGRLFDEYNVEGKRPTPGAAIDMFSDKTASRRFVDALMKMCPIFDRSEIEMRSSTIAAASRKITTVSTLDVAIKPYQKDLLALEKNKPVYDDLIEFFSQFYAEWAKHYQEYQPTASGKARQELRERSFAMANIMFFPMFRLAYELWDRYRRNGTDWKTTNEWRDALARIAGETEVEGPDGKPVLGPDGEPEKVSVMARDIRNKKNELVAEGNPAWRGKILIQQFKQDGTPSGWTLSSTRGTRDAAYHYLAKVSGINFDQKTK